MREVTIAKFRKDIPAQLKDLPVALKRYNKIVAVIEYNQKSVQVVTKTPQFEKLKSVQVNKSLFCPHNSPWSLCKKEECRKKAR